MNLPLTLWLPKEWLTRAVTSAFQVTRAVRSLGEIQAVLPSQTTYQYTCYIYVQYVQSTY